MHIYFSGVGGVGIGPLAQIAKQAGYEISGSDIKDSSSLHDLRKRGIKDIHIGQTVEQIAAVHKRKPIDWFVYSSALPKTNPNHPELKFCEQNGIRSSKRDEFLNKIIGDKKLKLIAIAGTQGKTTTTAMVIWLLKELGVPVSYSVGARISFGEMGEYNRKSQYFIYECDEFDRNFLAFSPHLAIISGLAYDHHEIYLSEEDYNQAFRDFLAQSQKIIIWQQDIKKLNLLSNPRKYIVQKTSERQVDQILLPGLYNRRNGWLAIKAVMTITGSPGAELIQMMNRFPGVGRRFEKITENLYTDDAHTPEKIQGAMSTARELTALTGQKIVVIYEPLTNRRMHHLGAAHHSAFDGAAAIYWLPSYLAREDPKMKILKPTDLIKHLSPALQKLAKPMERNTELEKAINKHLSNGDLVVAMTGGGAGSFDEWLRQKFG